MEAAAIIIRAPGIVRGGPSVVEFLGALARWVRRKFVSPRIAPSEAEVVAISGLAARAANMPADAFGALSHTMHAGEDPARWPAAAA